VSEGQLLLEIRDLEVSFDGFKANSEVNLDVLEGELRFLIGPNGAGKTTLIDAITGLVKPSKGTITFDTRDLLQRREFEIVRLGVGRTFQKANVFEELTVVENLDLAASFRLTLPRLFRRRRGVLPEVMEALDIVGLPAYADRPAGVLSHGQKQWLEIGMLLVQNPMLLLLDEPVAGMSKSERTKTGELLQFIAQTKTLMVIEHDMDFVRRFSKKVTVLCEGRILCEGPIEEVQANPMVQEVYLGRAHDRRSQEEVTA
jgi:urea transport system ATP-binding protein